MNEKEARRVFDAAPFVRHLGVRLEGLGDGWCETALDPAPEHLQQDGVVHAGVQTSVLDHTAGVAAATTLPAGKRVLSIEINVSLLRAARGPLRCRAGVLKPGRRVAVAESGLWAAADGPERLAAKATVTLAVVDGPGPASPPR